MVFTLALFLHLNTLGQLFGTAACSNTRNVICDDANWGNQKKAVAVIRGVIKGQTVYTTVGTGTLLNNTCNYNIPYLLTAKHITTSLDISYPLQFIFGYWSSNCSSNIYPQLDNLQIITGATALASSDTYDFILYKLSASPSNVFYAGWSTLTQVPASATCLYHPNGDLMKIATGTSIVNGIVAPSRWLIPNLNYPIEGGASGCGIFDQNKRLVGEMFGNIGTCITNPEFNRFYNMWSSIRGFLDPFNLSNGGTSPLTIDGKTSSQMVADPGYTSKSITGQQNINYTSGQNYPYTINGLNAAVPVSWQSSDPTVMSVSGTNYTANATVLKNVSANITLTAKITTGCGFYNLTIPVTITGTFPVCGQTIFRPGVGVSMSVSLAGATQYRWRTGSITAPLIPGATGATYTYPISTLCPNNGDGTYFNGYTLFYVEAYKTGLGWSLPCAISFNFNCSTQTMSSVSCAGYDPSLARIAVVQPLAMDIDKLNIFPSPANDKINIQLSNALATGSVIQLHSAAGNLLLTKSLTAGNKIAQLNVNNMPTGIYYLTILGNNKRLNYKILIKH